ncbi:AMP-binding protein [Saccharopolyspora spinosa]|uniref:Long-subunit acyl-CoA synthetase (AMP-forming) n=1 Tax=Saccharopolyspora spinosa TaxID=60894 RepID=A0A2N3Y3F5_SACSN|nr:AMP-binding protein [Saccharopolyspora spinosa]PKW17463.1 long-subunit acyl-CoA synthetase (AMP-forming) [Saccharopolyspora spinosa]
MTVPSESATPTLLAPFAHPGDDANVQTVPQFVRRNAQRWPERTAFRTRTATEWATLSWSQVDEMMTELAAGLLDLGFGDARCAYVLGSNEPEFFVSEYAVQAIGATSFPLFEQMTVEEMRNTLDEYQAPVAFAGSADLTRRLLQVADEIGLRTVVQWCSDPVPDDRVVTFAELRQRGRAYRSRSDREVKDRIDRCTLDDIACIILTSGTTGKSKGVLGSYRYVLDIAYRYKTLYQADPFDSYLSYLPAAFSVEQYCGMALAAALPLNVACAESPATAERDFVSAEARFRFLGPRQWEEIRARVPAELLENSVRLREQAVEVREELGLGNVKAGISAGGSLSPEVFEFFSDIGLNIRSVYGFAEVGIVTGTRDGDGFDNVGHPLPSPYGNEPIALRVGPLDEVEISGGVTCSGYWDDLHSLSLTADGWIRSGDAGEWDGQVLRIYDRVDNIKRLPDGTRFAPQPIEINALRSPYISNIVLIGGHGNDPRIGALVQLNASAVASHLDPDHAVSADHAVLAKESAVIRLLTDELHRLADHETETQNIALLALMPKELSSEDGELTRSMKLRRAEVLRRYAQLIDTMYNSPDDLVSFDLDAGGGERGVRQSYETRIARIPETSKPDSISTC